MMFCSYTYLPVRSLRTIFLRVERDAAFWPWEPNCWCIKYFLGTLWIYFIDFK